TCEFRPAQHRRSTEDIVMLLLDSIPPALACASGILVLGGFGLVVLSFVFHEMPLPNLGDRRVEYATLAAIAGAGVAAWIARVRLVLAAWAHRRIVVDEAGVASYSAAYRRTFIPWTDVRQLRVTETEHEDSFSCALALQGEGARITVHSGEVAE